MVVVVVTAVLVVVLEVLSKTLFDGQCRDFENWSNMFSFHIRS